LRIASSGGSTIKSDIVKQVAHPVSRAPHVGWRVRDVTARLLRGGCDEQAAAHALPAGMHANAHIGFCLW
jgi:hypothetical protein